jgi:hypothetical protein
MSLPDSSLRRRSTTRQVWSLASWNRSGVQPASRSGYPSAAVWERFLCLTAVYSGTGSAGYPDVRASAGHLRRGFMKSPVG